ncbi:DUF998 domain-containing protein [Amycolatopsis sp. K13G38]|uniref:DUF998 domain-containing protein n=1 Tax=Amycolatopsis acididurans TaxID=2724524 RepID=A0ABX1JEU7_9PSEU|nr:DUF998 domain-containing protein [Amycolatopsis acididurans]NKQ58274.1 DUF998 domain-containing protein [Amycolatopsis acididurans]
MTQLATRTCPPLENRVTRSLLGYGVLAGAVYEIVSIAQAATREGFDFTRHSWSLLANGSLGWIQIANFVLTGAMTIAFAVGLGRATGTRWAPRLAGAFGASLILAGIFRADPARGFPDGATAQLSWHGVAHLAAGAVGFLCLITACLLVGRWFAGRGRSGWAWYSRATGIAFLAGFLCVSSGSSAPWATLAFVAAVTLAWAWIAAVAVHLYRH